MTGNGSPVIEATLFDAADYGGTGVAVRPDRSDEGGQVVAYSLARLGLSRLGSLRAPAFPADPDDPFRQEPGWITAVTVWASRPHAWPPDDGRRGRTWQEYRADTADLGVWGVKAGYVRVRKEPAAAPGGGAVRDRDAEHRIVVVE
ncbi:hypothetical protein [Streptomyces sp. NPDC089799]|uniref:hypothetical protein n=1 Tax=Streptomyces sp. NPDC089799 TaxID=3155066 RepID=UPI00343410A7